MGNLDVHLFLTNLSQNDMDKESIKKKLSTHKVKDYSYSIIFFLTFSFFVFFVIRPNLVNVFSLQEELGRLHILDTGYENVIKKIITIQTFLETNRSDLYLLDQAVAASPQINKMIDDIESAATSSGLVLKQVNMSEVNLRKSTKIKGKTPLVVNIETSAGFEETSQFINNLLLQRRLKTIKQISFEKDEKYGTAEAILNVQIKLEGYYL